MSDDDDAPSGAVLPPFVSALFALVSEPSTNHIVSFLPQANPVRAAPWKQNFLSFFFFFFFFFFCCRATKCASACTIRGS